jgi:hypothetical protein
MRRREFITLLSWARSASRLWGRRRPGSGFLAHPPAPSVFEFVDLHQYKAPLDL